MKSLSKSSPFEYFTADVPAGVVVYLVALPLCLGIALASTGSPDLLFSGIISGVIGGIVVGLLSGSALGVSGPAAGLVVIVLNALTTLGSFEKFLLAVVLAGVIQLIAGFLKAGIIGYYFPSSVIKGMLAAIGLTLILKEIPHALGFDEAHMLDESAVSAAGSNVLTDVVNALEHTSAGAIALSVVSLGLLILFDRPFMKRFKVFKFVPGALVVVVVGVILNQLLGQYDPSLQMTGKRLVNLPVASSPVEFFSFFKFPNWSGLTDPNVYVIAFTLAIIASLETLLSVEATDKLDPYKRTTPTNDELKAQGVGNILSGLIGGLPITQVVVRSSANIEAGGRTKLSAVVHGGILLLSAILIPQFLNLIPLAGLATILLMVGYKLSKFSLYMSMYKLGRDQFLPFIVTIIAILMTDLLKGIAIGMLVAIYFILRNNYKNSFLLEKNYQQDGTLHVRITLSEEVTFLNKGALRKALRDDIPPDATLTIDGTKSVYIDYDLLEVIEEFRSSTAQLQNIRVKTIGIKEVAILGGVH